MIQVLFFLRFRTQLRRTRPQLILQLEKAIVEALEGAGAIVEHKHRIITGYFNKQALGIWLTIITFLEEITALLGEADSELYGYSLVVSEDLEDYVQGWIGSNLAALSGGSRIWCERSVQPFLSPYVDFDGPAELASPEPPLPAFLTTYVQMKRFGLSSEGISESLQQRSGMKDKMLHILRYGAATNAVLVGPAFMGKRVALYRFCAEALGEIPPMILRFSPRKSLGALADMYSPPVRGLLEGHAVPEVLGELEGLQHVLFQERLMDEYSGYLLVQGRRFFTQLVRAYMTVVQDLERVPILILEDLHLADETMTDLVLDACAGFETLKVYGIYSYDPASEATPLDSLREDLCRWDPLLPKTLHFSKEYYIPLQSPLMSRDLWEVAYAARLLKPYFPGFLFPQLFQEAESTSAMALRAFTILARLGLIDVIEDPAPRFPRFTHLAEAWLGERKDHIRTFVRKRLLGWVLQGLLRPCFGLLEILAALDGQGDDNLVLNAVYGDVITGAYQGIQQAIKANCFETVVGVDKGPPLIYIFTTLKALIHGTEGEIHEAFTRPAPLEVLFSGYQIHILVNLTAYHLSTHTLDTALEVVKEAMLIGQKQRRGITRVYRLFALVNLARHQMDDAIDYISFAVENAERLEQWYDLAVAGYYAAIIQLLFGNLSWADQLALKAERAARRAGQSEWEDRIRFFQGKLHFETGCYQDALQLFTALKDHPSGTISPEREQLLLAWIYRTTIYLGEPEQSLPFSQDPGPDIPSPAGDALLFQVEASYITGDYQRTIRLTERLPLSSQSRFLYTERPDWRSGFTQCELLQIEPQGLWERMLLTYRGLALCRLSSPEAALEPVFKRVQHFVRNDMLPDRDMHDVFYFYAYYRMLKESEASDMDLNTAVSMAFKRLQHRANHIDDLETRRVFLNLHYWNNALILVAKEHKLT